MESRKLQKTGGSTFTLSLPKRWVASSGLKAGDTVFVDALADGALLLTPRPEPSKRTRKRVLTATGEVRDHLLRELIGAYVAGYDVIEIRFKPEAGPTIRRVAREFTRMTIGPEILEETRTSLVLQDLSDPTEMDAEKCLRRMYLTVLAMHEDAMEVVRARNEDLAKDVAQRDGDVDRLYWMVAKQYSLAHLGGPTTTPDWLASGIHNHRLVAKLLERIGDHAERVAHAALTFEKPLEARLSRDLAAASRVSLEILEGSFGALMARDVQGANAALDRSAELEKLLDALTHRVATHKGEELLALGAIVDSIRRTGGYATDIGELAINHVLAQEG